MSRSHGPDEFLDPRDTSAEAFRDPRQSASPEPTREQGQGKFAYQRDKDRTRADVQCLIRQSLVSEKAIPHPDTSPRRLLTLSKQGHEFLTDTRSVPRNQTIHYGFTKPREAHHDADLYRMYYTAADKIERQGGRNLRVILDYEMKKRVYHDLAKLGPHRESTAKEKGDRGKTWTTGRSRKDSAARPPH